VSIAHFLLDIILPPLAWFLFLK